MKKLLTKFLAAIAVCLVFGTVQIHATWYLIGDNFGNWDLNSSSLPEFKEVPGLNGVYTVNVPSLKGSFKIIEDRKWSENEFGVHDSNRRIDYGVQFQADGGGSNDLIFSGDQTDLIITIYPNGHSISIFKQSEAPGMGWGIRGDFDSNDSWVTYHMTENTSSQGCFNASFKINKTSVPLGYVNFGIQETYNLVESNWFGNENLNLSLNGLKTGTLSNVSGNPKLTVSNSDLNNTVYNFEWDENNNTISLFRYTPTLNVLGHVNGTNYRTNDVVPMKRLSDGEFCVNNIIVNSADGYGYLLFCVNPFDNWNKKSDTYAASSKDQTVIMEQTNNLVFNQSDNYSYKLTPGNYDIKVNLASNTPNVIFAENIHVNEAFSIKDKIAENGKYIGVHGQTNVFTLDCLDKHFSNVSIDVTCEKHQINALSVNSPSCTDVTDNSISFNHAGEYNISIAAIEDAEGIHGDTNFAVTIAKASTAATVEETARSFRSDKNLYNLEPISFDNAEAMTTNDFVVTIEPASDDWVKAETADQAAYQEAFGSTDTNTGLLAQYLSVKTDGNYVDGLYTSVGTPELDGSAGKFSCSATFPCSGVYNVTVKEAEDGNYTFEEAKTTITIMPELANLYNNIPGLNINGIEVKDNAVQYPWENKEDASQGLYNAKNSFAYTPGLYFADALTFVAESSSNTEGDQIGGNPENSVKRKADTGVDTNYYGGGFDFTKLGLDTDTSGKTITATVSKNGAISTYGFVFTASQNAPTGIEAVEAVDGEAEYFNLQGVKVANPERGIFIKVQNGKATKVIL